MKLAYIILGLVVSLTLSGQTVTPVEIPYFNSGAYHGKVHIYQSDKMESFIETYAGINEKRNGIWGYRVKIFADVGQNARKLANETKVRFNIAYPDIKVYLVYKDPNFEVHCGNFRTRYEAMGLLNKIKPSFPGCFVVYEIIEFPDL